MHAVIFLGFMALLARKLQLIVIGYDEPFVYPGVVGRAVRRRSRTPSRSRCCLRSPTHSGAATCVQPAAPRAQPRGAADPVADPRDHDHRLRCSTASASRSRGQRPGHRSRARLRVRRTSRRRCAFRPVAGGARRPATTCPTGCSSSWCSRSWCILPTGEHFHIVTALPTLFFRRGRPGERGAVRRSRSIMGDESGDARDADRRAHREGPHVEGRARRLHLHRVRPLQGRVPDVPHRQAAVA